MFKIIRKKTLRDDTKAVSPAISTVIITSALIVLVLATMTYARSFLNSSMAENEFHTNKQFMLTTGLQIDDIAWTIGRTQTVRYTSTFGHTSFKNETLTYTCEVSTNDGGSWEEVFSLNTGIIMFVMPVNDYSLGNGYFQRLFPAQNNSFCQENATAPISHVYTIEKKPMQDGSYIRTVAAPSIRMLSSPIQEQNYVKFYLPKLISGSNPMLSKSVTLTGKNIIHPPIKSDVTDVRFQVIFPRDLEGFDSDFFDFDSETVSVHFPSSSVVEFYIGEVSVSIGLHA